MVYKPCCHIGTIIPNIGNVSRWKGANVVEPHQLQVANIPSPFPAKIFVAAISVAMKA
jgi:hypothetical protein